MKFGLPFGRSGSLALAVLTLLNMQLTPVYAQTSSSAPKGQDANSGVLPLNKNNQPLQLIDDLFPMPPKTNSTDGSNNSNNNTGNNSSGPGTSGHSVNPPTTTGSTGTTTGGTTGSTGITTGGTTTPSNPGSNNPNNPRPSNIKSDFRCNLFENPTYEDVLSAVSALNAAANSPNCGNNSKMNTQTITSNTNQIANAVKSLHGYLDNPQSIPPEQVSNIVTTVDGAVQAASNLATTFSQSDLFTKQCSSQMGPGQVALALNNLVNGLTPFALMAASFVPAVGTATIPFIVGGSVITNAVGALGQIIQSKSANMSDPQVRRAVVENTCQFIRVNEKYNFLLQSRAEQLKQITKDVNSTRNMFSTKLTGFSSQTTDLINRKISLDQTSTDLGNDIKKAKSELDLDQTMISQTKDDLTVCELGIQLAANAQDPKGKTYVTTMLNSLDKAITAYGSSGNAQAQALKASAKISIAGLQKASTQNFDTTSNFSGCATTTRALISTVNQSGVLANQLVSLAETNLETQLQATGQYAAIKSRLDMISQKRNQAQRLTNSLDQLNQRASGVFSQSEMDTEMERLRTSMFSGTNFWGHAPLMDWFSFMRTLHTKSAEAFSSGLDSLKQRAFYLTASGKSTLSNGTVFAQLNNGTAYNNDWNSSHNLATLDLKHLPLGTREHEVVCSEMRDVMNRWLVALDHLDAIASMCAMIDHSIVESRPEDKKLLQMCRGNLQANGISYAGSTLMGLTAALRDQHLVQWGNFLQSKIDAMVCLSDGLGLTEGTN